jgi:hypothetical protein
MLVGLVTVDTVTVLPTPKLPSLPELVVAVIIEVAVNEDTVLDEIL